MSLFVQLGATRDGLDPYLHVAHTCGMEALLIETPDYIGLRKLLGRKTFDHTIAVAHPTKIDEVLTALENFPETPSFILAGFERYIYSAYAVAQQLQIPPFRPDSPFFPPNKAEQRIALSECSTIAQPRFRVLTQSSRIDSEVVDLTFPLVLKPIDGGGGLGVFLITDMEELKQAWSELDIMTNYDGGSFHGFILEEFLPGTEFSVQGVVRSGRSSILTQSQKFILIEPDKDHPPLLGFREVGHIAVSGQQAHPAIQELTQQCIETLAYDRGPFHIDMVLAQGKFYVLELGFRLSGSGLALLAKRVSGRDWAAETFAAHLSKTSDFSQTLLKMKDPLCIGQITVVSLHEIERAVRLQALGYQVEVQKFTPSPILASTSLQSDLIRHGGFLGRIIVSGKTFAEVEDILRFCSPNRTFRENLSKRHYKEQTKQMTYRNY